MYSNILIATDLSELARKGVTQGLELASALGARVTILTVSEPLSPAAIRAASEAGTDDPVGRYDIQIDRDLRERLARFEEEHRKYDIEVTVAHEIDEHPAEAIVRHAELHDHDLIVMTSHGRRGLKKVLLGSQTSEVLVTTKIPVLVVR